MDLKALYKITYGLYVVCAKAGEEESGCVVNTLAQVTSEPVRLAVTVSKESFTRDLIEKSGRFAAVALDQTADLPYIGRFGFRTGRDFQKFNGIATAQDQSGVVYPAEHICARYSCKLIDTLDLGTHTLFLGEAEEAEIVGTGEPLTYSYYRTVIKGGTPKNAPSYQ